MKQHVLVAASRQSAANFVNPNQRRSAETPLRGRACHLLASVLLLAVFGSATLLLTSCSPDHASAAAAPEEQLYTCGMHPQVIQNHPGNCPICGMKLTPVRKQAAPSPAASNSASPSWNPPPSRLIRRRSRT